MNKIVLIGAGSTNFGLGTVSDIFKSKQLNGSTIVLHDINPITLAKNPGAVTQNHWGDSPGKKRNR